MKRHNNNVRDLRGGKPSDERRNDTLKYGKASQSPMAENVGNINLHKGAGDDTDTQGQPNENVQPQNRRAADINGVEWRGE
jgi:hypothetical protein